jgi:Lon protease-like protein
MTEFAMFPLGSVLFPHMPLPLRVFEERYLAMLSEILQAEPSEFGVVLIERGQEVGGGEQRFSVGTVAQISGLEAGEGFIAVVAEGDRRFEVVQWLDEDPYPRASIREIADLHWDEGFRDLFERAELVVRRTLAKASEFSDQLWAADVEISDDPSAAIWQIAAIAPLNEIDQIALLRSQTVDDLLNTLIELCESAAEALQAWPDDLDLDDSDTDGGTDD